MKALTETTQSLMTGWMSCYVPKAASADLKGQAKECQRVFVLSFQLPGCLDHSMHYLDRRDDPCPEGGMHRWKMPQPAPVTPEE